jgi:hypothetical protein
MTVTIELTPGQEAQLTEAALQTGVEPQELVQRLVTQHLPEVVSRPNVAAPPDGTQERDPERVALVRSIRGKYAHTAKMPGTEELHRERQRDKAREEARIQGYRHCPILFIR